MKEKTLPDPTFEPLFKKSFPDGREAHVWPLIFGTARIQVGVKGSPYYDDAW